MGLEMKKALLLTTTLCLSLAVHAESIGKIVKVKGDVKIVSLSGEQQEAKALSELELGALVQTGNGSYAKVIMKDDTVFQIGPNSDFSLDQFEFETKNIRTAAYSLTKGQLRSWFVHKSPDKTLTIKTPTASMGIRGTEILTDVYSDTDGNSKTDIALVRGKLEVASNALGEKIMLSPGQMLDSLGERVKGRAPASARREHLRNLSQRVFEAVKRNSVDGDGAIFLNDARKKFGGEKLKDKVFDRMKDSGRGPASVKNEEIKIDKDKILGKMKRQRRNNIRQQVRNPANTTTTVDSRTRLRNFQNRTRTGTVSGTVQSFDIYNPETGGRVVIPAGGAGELAPSGPAAP
ncbi:MAG: hypothetical protein COW01_10435 [Bdellovibrionales bacterium CG12_big_fil_rev_8_21_14_0_65_38_15]|nr:MAG: hypothetical protein COW79_07280 [Bdellovibrionales bacterium CG22_combo_CG10-13_8_21_14_all_38_13]PIQ54554.1 MAG: hypothetical protein COW01_10435 [Bdellovibrionales bacterium CG12_big_fil_rev_8_21_14_0_65_38_15]PIR29935.1 MAG: hypothetical protein COV38_08280 [Bdellovibrionales bacterium CG11_big_fil_rev_8_21_14_0_20_38_13]